MNTIKKLLEDADPLRHERANTDVEKTLRDEATAIAAAASLNPPPVLPLRRGRLLVISVTVLIIGASLIGPRVWPLFVQKSHAAVRFEVRLAEELPEPGLREAIVRGNGHTVYLHEEVIATNGDIDGAYESKDPNSGRPAIGLKLKAEAAQRMLSATQAHIGRPIAILIDNEVVMAPRVNDQVSDAIQITGNFTKSEIERIVAGIQ